MVRKMIWRRSSAAMWETMRRLVRTVNSLPIWGNDAGSLLMTDISAKPMPKLSGGHDWLVTMVAMPMDQLSDECQRMQFLLKGGSYPAEDWAEIESAEEGKP